MKNHTQTENSQPMKRFEMEVLHLDSTFTAYLPLVGPGNYEQVMAQIDEEQFLRPTTAQVFSVIDHCYQNQDDENCANIIKVINGREKGNLFREKHGFEPYFINKLCSSTKSVAFDYNERIVFDDPEGKISKNIEQLCDLCDGKKVRSVRFPFTTNIMELSQALENPFLLAQVGCKEMIPVVERVAQFFSEDLEYRHYGELGVYIGTNYNNDHTYVEGQTMIKKGLDGLNLLCNDLFSSNFKDGNYYTFGIKK